MPKCNCSASCPMYNRFRCCSDFVMTVRDCILLQQGILCQSRLYRNISNISNTISIPSMHIPTIYNNTQTIYKIAEDRSKYAIKTNFLPVAVFATLLSTMPLNPETLFRGDGDEDIRFPPLPTFNCGTCNKPFTITYLCKKSCYYCSKCETEVSNKKNTGNHTAWWGKHTEAAGPEWVPPQRPTSHHTTPCHTTPHLTALIRTTPHHTTQHHSTATKHAPQQLWETDRNSPHHTSHCTHNPTAAPTTYQNRS